MHSRWLGRDFCAVTHDLASANCMLIANCKSCSTTLLIQEGSSCGQHFQVMILRTRPGSTMQPNHQWHLLPLFPFSRWGQALCQSSCPVIKSRFSSKPCRSLTSRFHCRNGRSGRSARHHGRLDLSTSFRALCIARYGYPGRSTVPWPRNLHCIRTKYGVPSEYFRCAYYYRGLAQYVWVHWPERRSPHRAFCNESVLHA